MIRNRGIPANGLPILGQYNDFACHITRHVDTLLPVVVCRFGENAPWLSSRTVIDHLNSSFSELDRLKPFSSIQ